MVRLIIVELRRVTARGATRVLTILGALVIVAVGVLAYLFVATPEEGRARREEVFGRRVEQCIAAAAPDRPAGGPVRPELRAGCEQRVRAATPPPSSATFDLDLLWPAEDPPAPAGEGAGRDVVYLFRALAFLPGALLLVGGIAGGASMVGAEWQAGTFVTLLTWEPRRLRLFAARLVAVAAVGFTIAVGLLGLFTVAMIPAVVSKGGALPSADWWLFYAGMVARLGAFVALTAAVGAALAMIAQRTVVAVFALLGYLIGGEFILRQYWEAAHPWLLLRNLAVALGASSWFDEPTWRGAGVLVGYSLLIIALAAAAFVRRDVASSG